MSDKRIYPATGKPPTHRYHVRLHFTPAHDAGVTCAVVGSTNDPDEAMKDLDDIRVLHKNADIFDSVTTRVFTVLEGWGPVHPATEPPQ